MKKLSANMMMEMCMAMSMCMVRRAQFSQLLSRP